VTTGGLLLSRVLAPYRDSCRYLRSADLIEHADGVAARGDFGIAESCYIDDTGHFNAVEFNICYNQLSYYLAAKCVRDGLLSAFATWSMDDYWERQLSSMLILRFSSRFRRAINPRSFEGEVVFQEPMISKPRGRPAVMYMGTTCAFRDGDGGAAEGEITVAFTKLP
jgi:hypothetical protein